MDEYSIRPPSYMGGSWTLVKHTISNGTLMSSDYSSYPTLEFALVAAAQLNSSFKMVIPLMNLPNF